MSNFKSGSGNLDFGGNDSEDSENESSAGISQSPVDADEDSEGSASIQSTPTNKDSEFSDTNNSSHRTSTKPAPQKESAQSDSAESYPYFIRRSNVGDERDTRLELHVRDKVADHEAEFRNDLAEHLGVNEVSKTDAREFALLAAFRHPDTVAELMEKEGFGTLK
ncbi:acyl-CoA dehydrogenase [Natrinema halophilum]|uniref:acyl-CoA dehydrogenase n=1 Tax=Natrinema halophilum TaxID=1699371 RepID=UPI001F4214A4|nr:acyl-CoA dehydrogenase [Natrinema halophilum]UHQ96333.1 acyl-CoA dehydrogenase [Natrinema halophilum]